MKKKKRCTKHDARRSICFAVSAGLLAALPAAPALAQTISFQQTHAFPKTQINEKPLASGKEPVLLASDKVAYDQKNNIATATGHVEIVQGATVLMADQVTYDINKNTVTASGHVAMSNPTGDVFFADGLTLENDMKAGVIGQLKGRLSDNSTIVAAKAHKIDEQHTELFKAAYTPCNCEDEDGEPETPAWALKAGYVMMDQQAQEMRYNDATFNVLNLPVLYTPYLSTPTPGAPNQSGLLMPSFMQSTNIGAVYKQPVYYAMAPDKDITLTPWYTTLNGPVLGGEYRQKFDSGLLDLGGSIANAPAVDALGNPIAGQEMRGNIDSHGDFKLSDNYDWGFKVRRASDDTYLQLYNISNDPFLISKIYGEGFRFINAGDTDRTYASVQGLSFQGLTGQDNPKVIPVVLPLTDVTWQSEPGIYHSRLTLDGDLMSLYRQSGDDSRRLSGTVGWKLPYITEDGQVIQFNAALRSDVYDVNSVPLADGTDFSGTVDREIPQASVLWRYPFITRRGASSLMLEPVIEADMTAGGNNPQTIPNEDSLVPEFNDTNLFSPNRFPGFDRVESGSGMSYGVHGQAQLYSDKYIDWLLGQHYRIAGDAQFPFANDLDSRFSDYVGRVGLTYMPFILAYRFRIDHESFAATRNEIDASFSEYPFTLTTSYLWLRNDPVLTDKETITGTARINLNKEWSWNFTDARDLLLKQTDTFSTGLAFKNECVNVTTMVGRNYTFLEDIKPSLTFWLTLSLKNLE